MVLPAPKTGSLYWNGRHSCSYFLKKQCGSMDAPIWLEKVECRFLPQHIMHT